MSDSFKVGNKVRVVKYGLNSYGLVGTVTNLLFCGLIEVEFTDWHGHLNKRLTFSKGSLEYLKSEKTGGNEIMSLSGNYNVVMVNFITGYNTNKEYAFAGYGNVGMPGDYCLVDSNGQYQVAKIVKIVPKSEYTGTAVTKEVICGLDFSAYYERKAARKKRNQIKNKMDNLVRENQELVLYQMLAEKNPEMAEMLAQYKSLADV